MSFELIILTGNSLSHILHLKDLENCLNTVKHHLASTGRFYHLCFYARSKIFS